MPRRIAPPSLEAGRVGGSENTASEGGTTAERSACAAIPEGVSGGSSDLVGVVDPAGISGSGLDAIGASLNAIA
ncbi:MAG: hypothetical protein M3018_08575, partial [Actinomycetota bacterium]|nr:hypothetical protein [Actinomycetota bacterium]